jgi:hypothetical protein
MNDLSIVGHSSKVALAQAGGERIARAQQSVSVRHRRPAVHRRHDGRAWSRRRGRGIEIVGAVDGGTAWTGHVERSGHGRHSRGMFERARQVTKVLEPRDVP